MQSKIKYVLLVAFFWPLLAHGSECPPDDEHNEGQHHPPDKIHLASWNWEEVGIYLTITFFIVVSGLAKVVFHKLHWLSSRVPESCLLVVVGVIMGAILHHATEYKSHILVFTPNLFFFALLPPIILESAYSLYDHAFFDNIWTILSMAVIGTAINFLLIGFLLYLVYQIGAMGQIRGLIDHDVKVYDLQLSEVMLFASLISAVDPVAVLAIFQEVGVNPDLYFLVFGESLLNDGVAVVFYKTMSTLAGMDHEGIAIEIGQYFMGILSFFTIALGGLLIGIIIGFVSALITRTTNDVRVMEPLALLGMAYIAYLCAELFHWSGIISLIGCGLVQAHYAFRNVSRKSRTTVKYFIKMASSTSDIIIFLFLGLELMKFEDFYWHTGFVVWTISFCLICRFVSVYGLVWLSNKNRLKAINLQNQFIMAYGGLRGAVGFSLVLMIQSNIPPRKMFITTTLAVVMFTIFVQGTTIKFLVDLLNIDKKSDEQKLITEEVNDTLIEHIMSGVDVISGKKGRQYLQTWFEYYDERYLKRIFCNQKPENELTRLFEKLALEDHLLHLYGPALVHGEGKSAMLLKPVRSAELLGDSDNESGRDSNNASNPLLEKDPPPPLPPRAGGVSKLMRGLSSRSFRKRSHTDTAAMHTLHVPGGGNEIRRRRSSQREDLDLVRHAFKNASTRRLVRHDVSDVHDNNIYDNLKERHIKARRISHLMLKHQLSDDGGRSPSPCYDQQNFFHDDVSDGNSDVALRHVSHPHRLGAEAVVRRYSQRVKRTLSTSSAGASDFDPTYANVNEIRRTRINITKNKMAEIDDEVASSKGSSTSKAPPVERKKNASGRRKLTPHPLNPNNSVQPEQQTETKGAESKLSILDEDEEGHSSDKSKSN